MVELALSKGKTLNTMTWKPWISAHAVTRMVHRRLFAQPCAKSTSSIILILNRAN